MWIIWIAFAFITFSMPLAIVSSFVYVVFGTLIGIFFTEKIKNI